MDHSHAGDIRLLCPLVWVLTDGRAGDDAQSINLAKALGWPFEARTEGHSLGKIVFDRLCDAIGLPLKPRIERPATGWPDLVIAVGGRNVSTARRIRRTTGGRTRVVMLGRPWARLDAFDLVVSTPQYRLPAQPNVLQILLPLNRVDPARLDEAARGMAHKFQHLPRPWLGVLVGGTSGSFRMTPRTARRLADHACAQAAATGGSLLIATSPRTPAAAADSLFSNLTVPHFAHRWQRNDADNPYAAILALSDRFLVTGESASMVAETVSTGKPVEIFALKQRFLSRILASRTVAGTVDPDRALEPRGGGWSPWRTWLIRRGLWIPARDLRHFHALLSRSGRVSGGIPEIPSECPSSVNDMDLVLTHIRALFDETHRHQPITSHSRPLEQTHEQAGARADGVY